jgi:hypothetical protein
MPVYPQEIDHRRGYFVAPRGVDNFEPIMRDRTGVLARLWILLHARATSRPKWAHLNGDVWLDRGQCALGVREVSRELGVDKNTAARALDKLEKYGLIERKSGHRGTVVSIVNYGVYGEDADTDRDTDADTGGTPMQTPAQTTEGHCLTPNERENGRTGERENVYERPAPAARAVTLAPGDFAPSSPDLPGGADFTVVDRRSAEAEIVPLRPNGGLVEGHRDGLPDRYLAVAVMPDQNGLAVLPVSALGTQTTLQVYDPEEPAASTSAEQAVVDGLARVVVGWLNALHRSNGRMQNHRGFQYDADDVQAAAKRWRKAKLKPEEVIAVCEHRIAGWKAIGVDWLNNCKPSVLFAPQKFKAARDELLAGFRPIASMAGARGVRPGVATAPNEHYRDKGIGECEI